MQTDTLTASAAAGNKLSLVSDLGVQCLLPASLVLWQANTFACRWGKLSCPSQSLAVLRDEDRKLTDHGNMKKEECWSHRQIKET